MAAGLLPQQEECRVDQPKHDEVAASRTANRREWVSPRISRMKATDAEAGANPIVPEGLGFGS